MNRPRGSAKPGDETQALRHRPSTAPLRLSCQYQELTPATVGLIAPTTQPGSVDVFISVGERGGTPRIALPHPETTTSVGIGWVR